MKTLFTIPMLVTIIAMGILSARLFQNAHYSVSALLTVSSFLIMTLMVIVLQTKKIDLQ
jgi:hypothetical protein